MPAVAPALVSRNATGVTSSMPVPTARPAPDSVRSQSTIGSCGFVTSSANADSVLVLWNIEDRAEAAHARAREVTEEIGDARRAVDPRGVRADERQLRARHERPQLAAEHRAAVGRVDARADRVEHAVGRADVGDGRARGVGVRRRADHGGRGAIDTAEHRRVAARAVGDAGEDAIDERDPLRVREAGRDQGAERVGVAVLEVDTRRAQRGAVRREHRAARAVEGAGAAAGHGHRRDRGVEQHGAAREARCGGRDARGGARAQVALLVREREAGDVGGERHGRHGRCRRHALERALDHRGLGADCRRDRRGARDLGHRAGRRGRVEAELEQRLEHELGAGDRAGQVVAADVRDVRLVRRVVLDAARGEIGDDHRARGGGGAELGAIERADRRDQRHHAGPVHRAGRVVRPEVGDDAVTVPPRAYPSRSTRSRRPARTDRRGRCSRRSSSRWSSSDPSSS